MNKEAYAPFEIHNGFASDRFLRNEPSRAGECEIKTRVNPAPALPSSVLLMSRSQWRKTRNRKVIVGDSQAKRVIVTSTGHHLHLFDESQTKER
jgi:hypothetical protein